MKQLVVTLKNGIIRRFSSDCRADDNGRFLNIVEIDDDKKKFAGFPLDNLSLWELSDETGTNLKDIDITHAELSALASAARYLNNMHMPLDGCDHAALRTALKKIEDVKASA